jgi:hypothetical protein
LLRPEPASSQTSPIYPITTSGRLADVGSKECNHLPTF